MPGRVASSPASINIVLVIGSLASPARHSSTVSWVVRTRTWASFPTSIVLGASTYLRVVDVCLLFNRSVDQSTSQSVNRAFSWARHLRVGWPPIARYIVCPASHFHVGLFGMVGGNGHPYYYSCFQRTEPASGIYFGDHVRSLIRSSPRTLRSS